MKVSHDFEPWSGYWGSLFAHRQPPELFLRSRSTLEGRKQPSRPRVHQAATEFRDFPRSDGVTKLLKDATMVRLPRWDTPSWRLPPELRPFYQAVNRLHQLQAKSGASSAEIDAARRAVGFAGVQLVRHIDAIRLFGADRATVRHFGRA